MKPDQEEEQRGSLHFAVVFNDELLDLVEGVPVNLKLWEDATRLNDARDVIQREQVIIGYDAHLLYFFEPKSFGLC